MNARCLSRNVGRQQFYQLLTGIIMSTACTFINMDVWAQSPATVNLGTAGNFTVLSGAAITDTTGTIIDGNVGASPITGAAIDLIAGQVNGTIYAVDAAGPVGSVIDAGLLNTAKNNLTTAYNDAAGRVLPT